MSFFEMGEVIRYIRRSEKMTQEEFCYELCETETLSRLENGKNQNRKLLKKILETMKEKENIHTKALNGLSFIIQEQREDIYDLLEKKEYEAAVVLIKNLKEACNLEALENKQYITYVERKLLDGQKKTEAGMYLRQLEDSIKMTIPEYSEFFQLPELLSSMELEILDEISNINGILKHYENAIYLLKELKSYVEKKEGQGSNLSYHKILYDLSKWLGLSGQQKECRQICEYGMKLCIEAEDAGFLCNFLRNKLLYGEKQKENDEDFEKLQYDT